MLTQKAKRTQVTREQTTERRLSNQLHMEKVRAMKTAEQIRGEKNV